MLSSLILLSLLSLFLSLSLLSLLQKPKSVVAAGSVKRMNPSLNIEAQQNRVGTETEGTIIIIITIKIIIIIMIIISQIFTMMISLSLWMEFAMRWIM